MNKELLTCKTNLKLDINQFKIIDEMSFNVKNLYNSTLYQTRLHYESTNEYIGYQELDKLMRTLTDDENKIIYRLLPAQIAQQTIKKLDKNFKSFFKLLRQVNSGEYQKPINTPNFLPKDGRKELIFSTQSFIIKDDFIHITVSKDLNKGRLKLCRVPKYLDENSIRYLEIVPGLNSQYSLHIVYEVEVIELNNTNVKNWVSIDLGLNNLCAVASNCFKPYLLNGRPLKSINQKYNKKISKLQSINYKQKKFNTKTNFRIKATKQIQQLYSKRSNKLNSEIHKITDFIIKSVKEYDIDTVVIGYNKEWKQNINLSKKNNQNFVQIPFIKIISQLQYKLKLLGINLIIQEESYTSKTSFLDLEPICKPENSQTYKGKRIQRGLFRTSIGKLINADINAALNIFRKSIAKLSNEVQDALLLKPLNTGLVMNPLRINLNTNISILDVNSKIETLKYFNENY